MSMFILHWREWKPILPCLDHVLPSFKVGLLPSFWEVSSSIITIKDKVRGSGLQYLIGGFTRLDIWRMFFYILLVLDNIVMHMNNVMELVHCLILVGWGLNRYVIYFMARCHETSPSHLSWNCNPDCKNDVVNTEARPSQAPLLENMQQTQDDPYNFLPNTVPY